MTMHPFRYPPFLNANKQLRLSLQLRVFMLKVIVSEGSANEEEKDPWLIFWGQKGLPIL